MSYDSWKLGDGADNRVEELVDRCCEIESYLDQKLGQVIDQANRASDVQWDVEPVLAEAAEDGQITLEVFLRLKGILAGGNPQDLLELAQALQALSDELARAARGHQTAQGLMLAPSVQNRTGKAELG